MSKQLAPIAHRNTIRRIVADNRRSHSLFNITFSGPTSRSAELHRRHNAVGGKSQAEDGNRERTGNANVASSICEVVGDRRERAAQMSDETAPGDGRENEKSA